MPPTSSRHALPPGWLSLARSLEAAPPDIPEWLDSLGRWVIDFVVAPHPDLGRNGAVCPFVAPSLAQDLLWVTSWEGGEDEEDLERFLLEQSEIFLAMPPVPPSRSSLYKSLLMAAPGLPESRASILKALRSRIKPRLLRSGVTCGEFYRDNDDGSVRNRGLLIAQSPVPCLALRYLSPHDEVFLRSQSDLYDIFLEWRSHDSLG